MTVEFDLDDALRRKRLQIDEHPTGQIATADLDKVPVATGCASLGQSARPAITCRPTYDRVEGAAVTPDVAWVDEADAHAVTRSIKNSHPTVVGAWDSQLLECHHKFLRTERVRTTAHDLAHNWCGRGQRPHIFGGSANPIREGSASYEGACWHPT